MDNDGALTIVNGDRTGYPLAWTWDFTGTRQVNLWSLGEIDVASFIEEAGGPPPTEPQLGPGGEMVPDGTYTTIDTGFGTVTNIPHLVYSPAGDNVNQQLVALYQQRCDLWKSRRQQLIDLVKALAPCHKKGRTP